MAPTRLAKTDISVVVPLYNHARFVTAALASVLAQTALPREIVVIDDGSTDGGMARAEAALRDTPGCRLITQANAGAHATLNRAIGLAEGSYVAVLNSDDCFTPEKLAWCHDMLATAPAPELIAGRVALIDADGRAITRGPAADWLRRAHAFADRAGLDRLALLHENHAATTSNMVFSRRLWEAVGGFAALRYCHDLDFLMLAFDHGAVALDRRREHVRYRVHAGNTIGEDADAIDVERAAVIAATLCDGGADLVPQTSQGVAAFAELVRARDQAGLVAYLMALRGAFPTRDAFYRCATAPEMRDRLLAGLRGRGQG